jgi:hypothetical protein
VAEKLTSNLIDVTLADRAKTHGAYEENARIAMVIREAMRKGGNWQLLSTAQRLSLEEIALKQARICSVGAEPSNQEPWLDIAGYATLGANHYVDVEKY